MKGKVFFVDFSLSCARKRLKGLRKLRAGSEGLRKGRSKKGRRGKREERDPAAGLGFGQGMYCGPDDFVVVAASVVVVV